jgi:hypothetical protein
MLLVGSPAASALHDEVPAFSGFAKKNLLLQSLSSLLLTTSLHFAPGF